VREYYDGCNKKNYFFRKVGHLWGEGTTLTHTWESEKVHLFTPHEDLEKLFLSLIIVFYFESLKKGKKRKLNKENTRENKKSRA
jgi:hypothetical protein